MQGRVNQLADFWNYVVKDGPVPEHDPSLGPCWTWTGPIEKSQGYGVFSCSGKSLRAHRVGYELTKGPIPPDRQLDHLCRNRGCPNPNHLEAVSRLLNILRGESFSAKNAKKTICAKGHPLNDSTVQVVWRKR